MQNDKKQLRAVYKSSQELDYDLASSLPAELSKSSAKGTLNSWASGALVDGIGQVWVLTDYLAGIWRTNRATANYFVGGIPDHDKANFDGNPCVKYSSVIYRLNEILQSPTTHKRRQYLRASEEMGISVRDSDQVDIIRMRYSEFVNLTTRVLKQKRIQELGLTIDELTSENLNQITAEFHHIRRQSAYPNLSSFIWNGLIINKETHNILTANEVSDEYDLEVICEQYGWSLEWLDPYIHNLNS